MKTINDKIEPFVVTGVKPGASKRFIPDDTFFLITEKSFEGKWKVIVYYPKDFTFMLAPAEILAYDKLNQDFIDCNAVLLSGSTDNEFCKVAWQNDNPDLKTIKHNQFADTARDGRSLANQLGIFFEPAGAALRATFIIDPDNVIQHVSVNPWWAKRDANDTLRILKEIQAGEACACNASMVEAFK